MKYIIILILLMSFIGCDIGKKHIKESTMPSMWIVEDINYVNDILFAYLLIPIDINNLNASSTWHLDQLENINWVIL